MILADVAREDASVVISDLKELGIAEDGAITLEEIDTQISEHAERAVEHARGAPADAVVWEEVEARTNENVELSGTFVAFMVIATLLAAVGIYQDSAILIVGAMVVGPEFGPLAGFCVAAVHRRGRLALRSAWRWPSASRSRSARRTWRRSRSRRPGCSRTASRRRTTASRTSSPRPTSSPSSSRPAPAPPACSASAPPSPAR